MRLNLLCLISATQCNPVSVAEVRIRSVPRDPKSLRSLIHGGDEFGESYVLEAAASAWSVKRRMPRVTTLLVTDSAVTSSHFDKIITVACAPEGVPTARIAKAHKSYAVLSAESEYVLFLDSDTYVLSDLSNLTGALRVYDLAAANDTWRYDEVYRHLHPALDVPSFPCWHPFFNTGVLLVRKRPVVESFLQDWSARVLQDPRIVLDQLVFRTLLWESSLRVHTLPQREVARDFWTDAMSGVSA